MSVIFVDKGHYKIGNEEYGYYLCDINFSLEFMSELPEDDLTNICQAIEETINAKIAEIEFKKKQEHGYFDWVDSNE